MNKRFFIVALSSLCIFAFAVGVLAADRKLSPALDIIAADFDMIKSGVVGNEVRFSEEDFEFACGVELSSVTVSSLPPEGDGKLVLGESDVVVGQTISKSNLELLRFIPTDGTTSTGFRFTLDRSYSTSCSIRLTDHENLSPVVTDAIVTVMTQEDITVFGAMSGYDPDGDKIIFEIVSYPTKGIIEVSDAIIGNFSDTPQAGVKGVDCFSYKIRDEFGNYSEECEVTLKIDERVSEMVLADMDGHWGYNAALSLVSEGAIDVICENDKLFFDPDEIITREEFVRTAMKALGAGNLSAAKTVFADDEMISESCKGYISAAYNLGIVKGFDEDNRLIFDPKSNITRAEAAVILNRIIGADTHGSVLRYDESVPTWASGDLSALIEVGILAGSDDGNIYAMSSLTRAEAAQMLFVTKKKYA